MITKNLAKALEDIGFKYYDGDGNSAHVSSIYNGYLITVYETSGKKNAFFSFRFSDNEENSLKKYNISESIGAIIEEYYICDYSIDEDGARIVSNADISVFIELLNKCTSIFADNEIRGAGYCSECGNKFASRPAKKVTLGTEARLLCEHCTLNAIEDVNKAKDDNRDNISKKDVIKGILGSALFSFGGFLLYILVYGLLSPVLKSFNFGNVRFIYCALGCAVAALSYLGYRTFCKKVSKCAYISISVNSLLFTVIGQYMGVVIEFINDGNYGISALLNKHFWLIHLRNTVPEDFAAEYINYSGAFYQLLGISVLFCIIGVAIFLLTLHDKSKANDETLNVETVILD